MSWGAIVVRENADYTKKALQGWGAVALVGISDNESSSNEHADDERLEEVIFGGGDIVVYEAPELSIVALSAEKALLSESSAISLSHDQALSVVELATNQKRGFKWPVRSLTRSRCFTRIWHLERLRNGLT